jgi:hypothetical protein
MRQPQPDEVLDGPRLDVTTTVKNAVPTIAESERPVCAVENGDIVGVVDRVAALQAIAGEGG